MKKENVIICPPCGENVALATKRGANKVNPILPRLPRLTAVLPPQGREITTRGFTLIELLVVVLIIGILAAVAVPQYQKAVEKSRATQAIALLKSMIPAMEAYYVSTGSFPSSFEEFDFELPADWTGNEHFTIGNISDSKSNKEWAIGLDSADSRWYAIQIGHWTGAYQGAGFAYYVTSAAYVPAKQLLCVENRQENEWVTPFEKEDGSFCEKLFNGTLIIDTGNQRFYTFQ